MIRNQSNLNTIETSDHDTENPVETTETDTEHGKDFKGKNIRSKDIKACQLV